MVAVFTKPPKVTKKERKKKKRRFCDCYSFYWILIFLIIWKWQFSNQGTTKHQVLIRADTWNFNWFSSTNCLMISKCLPKIYTGRLASIYWGWMKQNSRSTTYECFIALTNVLCIIKSKQYFINFSLLLARLWWIFWWWSSNCFYKQTKSGK